LSKAGQRTFDYDVEGQTTRGFDVIKMAGGNKRAIKRSVNVTVADGQLTMRFVNSIPKKDEALVSGIEILSATAASPLAPVAPTLRPPTKRPTLAPVMTRPPTKRPTLTPVKPPTKAPVKAVTKLPTLAPIPAPTRAPFTNAPITKTPITNAPITKAPIAVVATLAPATSLVKSPTSAPAPAPLAEVVPTNAPTKTPTVAPVAAPTASPLTLSPVKAPTSRPTPTPLTQRPTKVPTRAPSRTPTSAPVMSAPVGPPRAPFAPILINCGGTMYTDTIGRLWSSDTNFVGGKIYAVANIAIQNTTDSNIFRSERYGASVYDIPVPNGNYVVTLHFAEILYVIYRSPLTSTVPHQTSDHFLDACLLLIPP
jgi:Malectin domain